MLKIFYDCITFIFNYCNPFEWIRKISWKMDSIQVEKIVKHSEEIKNREFGISEIMKMFEKIDREGAETVYNNTLDYIHLKEKSKVKNNSVKNSSKKVSVKTILRKSINKNDDNTFVYENKNLGYSAIGVYINDDKFWVLKGAKIRSEPVNTFGKYGVKKLRDALIGEGIITENTLKKDYMFSAPSTAGGVISGSMPNGWKEWKNVKSGKSLDECFRKNK